MNIKKLLLVSVLTLSPLAMASPVMAMPQEQADCALTRLLSNSVQKEVAYRHTFEPFDSSKLDERVAESSDANDLVVACSKKYNWRFSDQNSVSKYTTFSLAFNELSSRLQKTGVDVRPLMEAINAVSEQEWVAFEIRDVGNVHIFNQLRALLLKQGFDTSNSKALEDQARDFLTISKLVLDAKIQLFNPDRAANHAVLVSRASAPVAVAQAPTERSDADKKWAALVWRAKKSYDLGVNTWNSISSEPNRLWQCYKADEAWGISASTVTYAVEAKKTMPLTTYDADRKYVNEFVDDVIVLQDLIYDYISNCNVIEPNRKTRTW
jgi:hypothetical protein